MEGKKSYQSWKISDEFGEAIQDEIPKKERARSKEKIYQCAPGQGCKPMPAGKALEGIFYVLQTGWLLVFLRRFWQKDWKGSAGNGRVWTAVW